MSASSSSSPSTTEPPMMIPIHRADRKPRAVNSANYLHPLLPFIDLWYQTLDTDGHSKVLQPWRRSDCPKDVEPVVEGTTRGDLLIFGRVVHDGQLVKQIDPVPGREHEGVGRGFEIWWNRRYRYEGEYLNGVPTGEFQLIERLRSNGEWDIHHPTYRGRLEWFLSGDRPEFKVTGQMYFIRSLHQRACLLLRSNGCFDSSTGEFTGTIYGPENNIHWMKQMVGRYTPKSATGEGKIFHGGRLQIDGGFSVTGMSARAHGRGNRFSKETGQLNARGTFHNGVIEEGERYNIVPGTDRMYLFQKGVFSDGILKVGEVFYPSSRLLLRRQLSDRGVEVTVYFDLDGSSMNEAHLYEKSSTGGLDSGKEIETRIWNPEQKLIERMYYDEKKNRYTLTFFDDGRPKTAQKDWMTEGFWERDFEEWAPTGRLLRKSVSRMAGAQGSRVLQSRTEVFSEADGSKLIDYTKTGGSYHGPFTIQSTRGQPIAQLNFHRGEMLGEQLLFRDGCLTHQFTVENTVPAKMTGKILYPSGLRKFEGEFHLIARFEPAVTLDVCERGYYMWSQKIKPKKGRMFSESGDREIEYDDSDAFSMLTMAESLLDEMSQRDEADLDDEYADPSEGRKRVRC